MFPFVQTCSLLGTVSCLRVFALFAVAVLGASLVFSVEGMLGHACGFPPLRVK